MPTRDVDLGQQGKEEERMRSVRASTCRARHRIHGGDGGSSSSVGERGGAREEGGGQWEERRRAEHKFLFSREPDEDTEGKRQQSGGPVWRYPEMEGREGAVVAGLDGRGRRTTL